MFHFRSVFSLTLITIVVSGCTGNAPSSVGTAYAPAESLAAYRTYAWSAKRTLSLRDPNRNTAAAKGWIESAVEAELAAKGLAAADPTGADLLVSYSAGSRSLTSTQHFTGLGELSPADRQEEGGSGYLVTQHADLNVDYEQGRLFLDLTDRKSGKVVYRGSAEAVLLDQQSPGKSVPRVKRAVKGMLKDWPAR